MAVEYLGTTQIITIKTPNGVIKARVSASDQITVGQTVGLAFNPRTITMFDKSSGVALLSDANKGVLDHG
jgi:multiple sugar transport system ATP-binding protein